MCIIVDANAARDLSAPTAAGKPVLKWLLKGKGGLIIGGKLKRELARAGLTGTMVTLSQAGRLSSWDDDVVDAMTTKVKVAGKCRSDDPHVIALAIVSKCQLLFTRDKHLHKDAKDSQIVSPPLSIYSSEDHAHLLKECHCG